MLGVLLIVQAAVLLSCAGVSAQVACMLLACACLSREVVHACVQPAPARDRIYARVRARACAAWRGRSVRFSVQKPELGFSGYLGSLGFFHAKPELQQLFDSKLKAHTEVQT